MDQKFPSITYLVYVSQIVPLRKYHSKSRSRRAYSARSSAAEGCGERRNARERRSNDRDRMRGVEEVIRDLGFNLVRARAIALK